MHKQFTTRAPNPTIDNSIGAGGCRKIICFQIAHMATKPGNNIIIDNKILIFAFFSNEREIAKKIKKLIDVSSIKSIESASKETDLMFRATINSIKKNIKFKTATKKTAFLKRVYKFHLRLHSAFFKIKFLLYLMSILCREKLIY